MFRCLATMLAVVVLLTSGCGCRRRPAWTYDGKLHAAVANADRIAVIDAGFDCYGRDSKAKTLFELSNPDEVRQFAEHLEFQKSQSFAACPCNGYPRIDWYRGKDRIATASIQHGQAIRWKGFQGDAKLTSKSSQWLQQWLADRGVDAAKMK